MKLFYKIIIGDSRKMDEVEDNSVDYIITSPPYWHLEVFSYKDETGAEFDLSRIIEKGEFFRELEKVWRECYRVLKDNSYITVEWEDYPVGSRIYGKPAEIFLAGDMVKSVENAGFTLISRLIWKKFEKPPTRKYFYTSYDMVMKADPRVPADWAYVFTFKKYGYKKRDWKPEITRKEWEELRRGIWYIKNPSEDYEIEGGAVFPEELVRRHLKLYSPRYGVVLDPFLGTGTTMKVAFEMERSCVGYEVLPRMLPVIKRKVGYGRISLENEIEWKTLIKYKNNSV